MIGQAKNKMLGQWTQTPSATPLQLKKYKMLVFGLHSTSDDWLGWSMDFVELKPHLPPLSSQKNKMLVLDYHFWITFNFWWSAGLVDGLEPHLPPLSSKKIKCMFLDYVQLLMIGWAGQWTWTRSTTPLQPKNKMLIFGLSSTSDDRSSWSMDSNPICHPSPAKKIKCSFLDYVQLLMIGWASRWTRTPSATPLQSKK